MKLIQTLNKCVYQVVKYNFYIYFLTYYLDLSGLKTILPAREGEDIWTLNYNDAQSFSFSFSLAYGYFIKSLLELVLSRL